MEKILLSMIRLGLDELINDIYLLLHILIFKEMLIQLVDEMPFIGLQSFHTLEIINQILVVVEYISV